MKSWGLVLLMVCCFVAGAAAVATLTPRYAVSVSEVDTVAYRLDRWSGDVRVIEYSNELDGWVWRDTALTVGRVD